MQHPTPHRNVLSSSPASTTSDLNSPISPSSTHSQSVFSQESQSPTKKRASRQTCKHALEKLIFSPHEIATLGVPRRSAIYLASLEAHIESLHNQLLQHDLCPVSVDALQRYKGLDCKTAKGMVAGLQHDIDIVNNALLVSERATKKLTSEYEVARAHQLPRTHQGATMPVARSQKQTRTQVWIDDQASTASSSPLTPDSAGSNARI